MNANRTFAITLAALVHHSGLSLRDSDPGGAPRVNRGAGLYLADLVHTIRENTNFEIRSTKPETSFWKFEALNSKLETGNSILF